MVTGENLSNIRLVSGKIVGPGEKEVTGKHPYRLPVDRGRPEGNQAGLPRTRGLPTGEGKHPDRRGMRWNFFGSTQAVLTDQQRRGELEEMTEMADQQEAGAKFEESISQRGRLDTLGVQIRDGVEQRKAEEVFNREMKLDEYDH